MSKKKVKKIFVFFWRRKFRGRAALCDNLFFCNKFLKLQSYSFYLVTSSMDKKETSLSRKRWIYKLWVGLPCNSIEKKKMQMILARALAHQPPPLPPYHKSIRSAFTVHRFRYISRYRPQSRASSSGAMNLFC